MGLDLAIQTERAGDLPLEPPMVVGTRHVPSTSANNHRAFSKKIA